MCVSIPFVSPSLYIYIYIYTWIHICICVQFCLHIHMNVSLSCDLRLSHERGFTPIRRISSLHWHDTAIETLSATCVQRSNNNAFTEIHLGPQVKPGLCVANKTFEPVDAPAGQNVIQSAKFVLDGINSNPKTNSGESAQLQTKSENGHAQTMTTMVKPLDGC